MTLDELLMPERVTLDLKVSGKPHLVQELARRAGSALGLGPGPIAAALEAREALGSTGLGRGFALPHARLPGLGTFFGLFARLTQPIDFQAIDDKPVDLVFLLLIPPEAEHVPLLAAISRRMREPGVPEGLRSGAGPAQVLALITGSSGV
jgi:PTS system nitrogen regulatory IIA component